MNYNSQLHYHIRNDAAPSRRGTMPSGETNATAKSSLTTVRWMAILLWAFAQGSFAQSGTAGPLTWRLDNEILTISGKGAMPDYDEDYIPWYFPSDITTIVIEKGVTAIGNKAFRFCWGLTSITLPAGMTRIGNEAFADCSRLPAITLPVGVTSIGDGAFENCSGLSAITLPEGVTSIGDGAFENCSGLSAVAIPEGVTSIGVGAFTGCSGLTSITVDEGNASFSSNEGVLFDNAQTTLVQYPAGKVDEEYVVPASVTCIGDSAFACVHRLRAVAIPASVKGIGDGAFADCSRLASVALPAGVTSIGDGAFNYCGSLSSIDLPEGVTSIGDGAFENCSGLTAVTLPVGVTTIGNNAFGYCNALRSVTNLNPVPQRVMDFSPIESPVTFEGVDVSRITLYVPAGSIESYRAACVWKDFGAITAHVPSANEMPAEDDRLGIYPNPVAGSFRIHGITAPAQVVITDLGGRTVWMQTVAGDEPVAATRLSQGIYLVRINGKTLKMIKQ